MAGAFSGLLAYAIAKMDGLAGYSGWRWIFSKWPGETCSNFLLWSLCWYEVCADE